MYLHCIVPNLLYTAYGRWNPSKWNNVYYCILYEMYWVSYRLKEYKFIRLCKFINRFAWLYFHSWYNYVHYYNIYLSQLLCFSDFLYAFTRILLFVKNINLFECNWRHEIPYIRRCYVFRLRQSLSDIYPRIRINGLGQTTSSDLWLPVTWILLLQGLAATTCCVVACWRI